MTLRALPWADYNTDRSDYMLEAKTGQRQRPAANRLLRMNGGRAGPATPLLTRIQQAMAIWVTDAIGMLGTFLIVLTYYLLQLERIDPKALAYNLLNLTGAACLLFSLCFNFNLASFVIELFWIGASLIGLWKYYQRRSSPASHSG